MSREAKLLWSWLDDNCDAAGVIDLDLACASFDIGGEITEKHLSELGDRIDVLPSGKYFIPKFIAFQYGRLSTDCRAHDKIFDSIEKHDLSGLLNGVAKPIKKVAAQEQDYHKDSKIALHLLNELSGKHFRDVDSNLGVISARLYEPGVDLAGVRQMLERQCRRWNGTDQAEYLRPETLFGKTKFDGYYAARSQPIETRSSKQTSQKFIEPDPHHIIDQVPSI